MPVEWKDVDGGRGSVTVLSGVVTDEGFSAAAKAHMEQDQEKFKKYRFNLTLVSENATLDLSTATIQEHSRVCIRSAAINPHVLVGLVSSQDLGFGLGRMWEMLSTSAPWEARVFRDSAEAKLWIKKRAFERWAIKDIDFS